MARENHVARFPRLGGVRNVTDGAAQNSWRIALDERNFQTKSRDSPVLPGTPVNHRLTRFGCAHTGLGHTLEFRLFIKRLISVRIREDIAGIAKSESSTHQKNVIQRAKEHNLRNAMFSRRNSEDSRRDLPECCRSSQLLS